MFKFLNRSISPFLAIGIIVILAVLLVLGTFYYANLPKLGEREPMPMAAEEIKVPAEWKYYKNEVLGISFYYPPEWGDPYTSPSRAITNLAKINEKYKDTGSIFAFMVKINFPRENTPVITIYNDEYKGRLYPNAYAYRFGPIDNFLEMKKSGDICKYKIKFDHRPDYEGTFDEVYSKCSNKVRTYITRNREVYFGTKVLYNYALRDSSFIKLQNGYFDNAFIDYFYSATQTPNNKIDLEDLSKKAHESYQKDKKSFVIFVNSIKAFGPVLPKEKSFQIISGEDPNITTIRKYYFEITKGNLQNAYNMYKEKKVSFETYKEWYKDALIANPVEFKKMGDNCYKFKVQFQNHNQEQELYRVTMKVDEGKIIPISSEKIIESPISFGNITAFVKQRFSKTYLVLSENRKEQILDEGSNSLLGDSPIIAGPLKFSPEGNYLISHVYGWEWHGINVYDVKNKKRVLKLCLPFVANFTPDEKYFFACARDDFFGAYYNIIYSVPDFKEIYNPSPEKDHWYYAKECEYDKDKQVIRFKLDVYSIKGETKQKEKQSKIVEFSTITGGIKTISD